MRGGRGKTAMLLLMDEFAQTVEDARIRLSQAEGRNISVRELARRAGVSNSTLAYNLSDTRAAEGRRVSGDLVRKLAAVLPVNEADLMRAAQLAAGYEIRGDDEPDLSFEVARYLDRDDVGEEQKIELMARLQEILAAEMRKARRERGGP